MRNKLLLMLVSIAVLMCGIRLHAEMPVVKPRQIEIVAKRFSFDPGVITLKKGEPVVLVLKSTDVPHGLRFRELGVDVKASKGKPGLVRFTPEKTGDFLGHCSVFCGVSHGSMTMVLHVVA
jgi:cytochrome c oxidase subunit II